MLARKIIHIDMDCFYAAVEEKYNPRLKGVPMAVGGPANSRGVICTANYEARKFGVRAAIPSSRAAKMCPHLILVPPNFKLYRQESFAVRKIMLEFTDIIQPLSLDEAYLDITGSEKNHGSGTLIAEEIRRRIRKETGLTASAGVAPNKFLAKIASDWKKPDGLFVIRPEEVEAFVKALPIEKIWGVGKVTAGKMHRLNLRTCEDIQKLDLSELKRMFGASRAQELWHLSRGQDDRPVDTSQERKSLTVEETFARDLHTLDQVMNELPALYEDWFKRMNASGDRDRIRSAVIKMKYQDFKSSTHEESMKTFPEFADFERLIRDAWTRKPLPIRLLGLGVRFYSQTELPEIDQLKLFS